MTNRIILFLIFLSRITLAQPDNDLTVFFDCDDCDQSFLKRNLADINFAREAQVSDLHILVTEQSTGSGGRNYRFQFIGRNELRPINFEMSYNADPTITNVERREEMLQLIEAGLKPFMYASQDLSEEITADQNGKQKRSWNNWVFQISSRFEYNKEVSRKEYEVNNEIDIERITEQWRIRSEIEHEYEENRIERQEGAFFSNINLWNISGSVVKSLNQHWSAGVFASAWRNTINNIEFGNRIHGALEYNFYPYDISHIKEFTLAYYIGPRYFNYQEETIFNQTTEQRYSQSLSINYDLVQAWGGVEARFEGFHYLNDFSQNRMELEADLFLRLVKGLFLRFNAEAQLIHDQIFLPKGDASLEEILLERKALATDFEFEFSVGLSYTFGALSNNVVNTRL